jgi:hypothetical protein
VRLDDYAEMGAALRAKLRWEQAAIGQLPDIPSSRRVYRLALRLEVLRRLDDLACRILEG